MYDFDALLRIVDAAYHHDLAVVADGLVVERKGRYVQDFDVGIDDVAEAGELGILEALELVRRLPDELFVR